MWSLCNEEPVQGTADGARIFAAMQKRVIQADPSRPITSAMNGGFGQGTSDVEDLQGFNYNIDAYDEFHRAHPRQPAFGSETASAVSTRGIYADDRLHGFVTAYDERTPGDYAATAQSAWKAIADRPYMAGAFVWTGFDYRGEPSPFNWPNISSNFGILDTCGFPKDDYYYYQSVWSNTPMVHLLPHWSWPGREGQAIAVWCYSNAARVNLLLNGRSLGSKAMPGLGHLAWSVPYIPGTLEARAYDRQGKVVARDRVETTGAPAALRLTTDRTILTADGEDMTAIEVSVVDAQGRVVPTAADLVTFQVQGAGTIAGVGNGDPTSHEADRAAQRHTFNGHCLVLIGAREQPGAIGLMASAPGLRSARLRLTAQRR